VRAPVLFLGGGAKLDHFSDLAWPGFLSCITVFI
jgi:hypothetical protein